MMSDLVRPDDEGTGRLAAPLQGLARWAGPSAALRTLSRWAS